MKEGDNGNKKSLATEEGLEKDKNGTMDKSEEEGDGSMISEDDAKKMESEEQNNNNEGEFYLMSLW